VFDILRFCVAFLTANQGEPTLTAKRFRNYGSDVATIYPLVADNQRLRRLGENCTVYTYSFFPVMLIIDDRRQK
jgi:hypothetical protein